MKRQIKKWTLRIAVTGLFIAGLLLMMVLHPTLTYANKTTHNTFTIYHNTPLDSSLLTHIDKAAELLKTSEFYNDKLKLDICLNDGSTYPNMIRAIRGQAFAWGFYDKVVLQGTMNGKANYVELNGYKWNLTQLLAHEMIHCLQFDKLGFWKSKPVANIDNWKWEGYAEYIARQAPHQKELIYNLNMLNSQNNNAWEITLNDSSISSREYVQFWTMLQYCMDIKKMTYQQLLKDTASEMTIKKEMGIWYENQN